MLRRFIRMLGGKDNAEAFFRFDPTFYLSAYPDVRGQDPLTHWRRKGRAEGRLGSLPDAFQPFDPEFYLALHADVAAAGCSAHEHWVRHGRAEGRIGAPPADLPPFDADYYRSRYADASDGGQTPFQHWLRVGRHQGRQAAWPTDARETPPTVRDLIAAHGLFDEADYLSNYREDIPEGRAALDHYLAVGQHQGHKPNPAFDPLLYLLRHPEARETGPLLHYLARLHRGEPAIDDLFVHVTFPEVRHPAVMLNVDSQPPHLIASDLQESLAHSEVFGDEQVLAFTIDGKDYRLVAPSADAIFDRLREDAPFALCRLPHGFWDCLLELRTARRQVREVLTSTAPGQQFSDDEISRLAERACHVVMPEMAVFQENFLRELLTETAQSETKPNLLRSVSFKWQPTVDDRVFGRTDIIGTVEEDQLRDFAAHFSPETPVFEAMVWKRWVYSGDVMRVADEARQRPVVLVGPRRLEDLGRRLELPWFSLLEIPLSSYQIRYEVLDRCKEAVREAKALAAANGTKTPLIMLQGGSFAYWLIVRLHAWDPSVFYMDFGQALHVWFLDKQELWTPWIRFHPRLVMENCGLDAFYEKLGIQVPPPFGLPETEDAPAQ